MATKSGNNSVKRKTVHHLDTPFSTTQWYVCKAKKSVTI